MPAQETVRKLADRYELQEPLGKGGMGLVWRARDTLLERDVAIKEVHLPPELSGSDRDAMQARVLREARAAARLSHPSVVTVFDVLQEQGTAYIVMELVNGPTLEEIVAREGPLEPRRVAGVGLSVLAALERAHAEGIVHRDVKPANVMLTPEGDVKLADFGIASLKGDPKLTATGILLGSPSYMAPEQAQDEDSGPAADLWALGATLYYAVEGEAPFDRGKPIPTLTAVVYDEPRPLQRAGELAPLITSLLAKTPADRPSPGQLRSALQVASEERPAANQQRARETPTRVAPVALQEPSPPSWREPWEEPEERPRTPRRWPLLAGAALLVALIAGGLLYGLLADGDDRPRRDDRAAGAGPGQPDDGGDDEQDPVDGGGDNTEGGGDTGGGEALPDQDGEVEVPAGWSTYADDATGYEISYPPDWEVQSGEGNNLDFSEPGTGTYLRVAWTDEPGPDPQAAWEDYSQDFAASHDNYQEIQITPTTFQGYDASLWEFTWSEGGTDLHAADLGFVTGDYGFALNFVTHEPNWDSDQELFEAFKASFQAP